MNILLTGSTGCLGSAIKKDLQTSDRLLTPSREELDITSEDSVHDFFAKNDVETVIHCAANPHGNSLQNVFKVNTLGTQFLAQYCKENTEFVFISTVVVYNDETFRQTGGADEDDRLLPRSVYGASKLAAENILHSYMWLRGIRSTVLRMCALVSPESTHGAFHDLLRKVNTAEEYVEAFGQFPGSIKPYLHIDDAVAAVRKSLRRTFFSKTEEPFAIFNVANPTSISIKDVIEHIKLAAGLPKKKIQWRSDKTWSTDNSYIKINNDKARLCLDWYPQYTSGEAVWLAAKEFYNKGTTAGET